MIALIPFTAARKELDVVFMLCHQKHIKIKIASHEVMAKEIEGINQSINVDTMKLEGYFPLTTKMSREILFSKMKQNE